MSDLAIEIFSDVVCPWCLVGTRRLEQVLASWDGPLAVAVTYRPFLLMPETPPEGINVRNMLRQKYGGDPRRMFDRVEAEAHKSGIALDLEKQPNSYPTVRAHTLLRHARAKGTQRALAQALYDAYFAEALNINDPTTLAAVATAHGFLADETTRLVLDPTELAETEREVDEAANLGIRGVPFFIIGGRLGISGAQPAEVFRSAIAQALEAVPRTFKV